MENRSLQEKYAPNNSCFGCGPANAQGLRIRSFPKGEEVVAEWIPQSKYEAFPGVLNGGIIGTLLDCHCNWTAACSKTPMGCKSAGRYSIALRFGATAGRLIALLSAART